ncbi:MAG: PD-(D/E)XK nuclease family protein, partial [Lachnospiraceae bacterium]|nr:PD-(D/E)XK nuclease family protein [Lachnospiraceae bacterium]
MTSEELLTSCRDVMDRSELVKNSYFMFDEFTGFTPSQLDIVEKILKNSLGVKIALTVDEREKPFSKPAEEELFGITKETIMKLEELCRETGTKRDPDRDLIIKNPYSDKKSPEISYIERNIFRKDQVQMDKIPEDVKLTECTDLDEETYYIADEIDRLVKQEGYRYRDFAVITSDQETYRRFFEKNFKHFGIPYFMDDKRSIEGNAYVEFIRELLNTTISGFMYDPLFSFLRSGLTGIPDEDIDAADNYALQFGIRSKNAWEGEWTPEDPDEAERLNGIRSSIYDIFMRCEESIFKSGLTVSERCSGIRRLSEELNVRERLQEIAEGFLKRGMPSRAQEYGRVYDAVEDIFDKFSGIMGDEAMGLREFMSILEEGFSNVKLGVVPSVQDETVIGDVRRTRLSDVKMLFFAGLNDNLIPAPISTGGVLNDGDKKILKEYDVTLSPDRQKKACEERFYLYTILSKPEEKLYLTFSRTGTDNRALRPSSLIGKITQVLQKLEAGKCELTLYEGDPLYAVAGDLSLKASKEADGRFRQAVAFLKGDDAGRTMLEKLESGAFSGDEHPALEPAAADLLFEDGVLRISVTALEKFAACKYRYFAAYTLGLEERKELKLRQVELGNIYHRAFEIVAKTMQDKGISWQDLSEDEIRAMVTEGVEKAFEDCSTGAITDTARNMEIMDTIVRVAENAAAVFRYQMEHSSFRTAEAEKKIVSKPMDLGNGRKLIIRGKLDRLDVCDMDGGEYLKVIDYKSGKKDFHLDRVYEGTDLQLFLYLNEITEQKMKKDGSAPVLPAAVFYINIDDPYVECFGADDEEIKKNRITELKPKGIVSRDEKTLLALDNRMENGYKSDIIPAGYKTGGGFNNNVTKAADPEQLLMMERHVKKLSEIMAGEIAEGAITADPFKKGSESSCEYCPYKAVCGFDLSIDGYDFRRPKKYTPEEIWEMLEQEEEADG